MSTVEVPAAKSKKLVKEYMQRIPNGKKSNENTWHIVFGRKHGAPSYISDNMVDNDDCNNQRDDKVKRHKK
jgi:endonuclease III